MPEMWHDDPDMFEMDNSATIKYSSKRIAIARHYFNQRLN